ncbi:MAG: hypothetical protein L3J41_14570 [Melioribacteraceae bacterium]|nr:hypothetical protein [Melioribacteraceae bacterium]
MRKNILILFLFFLVSLLTAQSLTEVTITFQVNMELEIAAARFDPATDTLFIRTSFDNWSDNIILSPSVTDTNIYVGSGNFETFDGELFYYSSEYISENKTFIEYGYFYRYTITDTDITNGFVILPAHGFNDTGGITMITLNEAEIKFIVDMNNAIDLNGTPFSSIDNVVIAGLNPPLELPTWGWPDSDSNKVIFMFDDGTIVHFI